MGLDIKRVLDVVNGRAIGRACGRTTAWSVFLIQQAYDPCVKSPTIAVMGLQTAVTDLIPTISNTCDALNVKFEKVKSDEIKINGKSFYFVDVSQDRSKRRDGWIEGDWVSYEVGQKILDWLPTEEVVKDTDEHIKKLVKLHNSYEFKPWTKGNRFEISMIRKDIKSRLEECKKYKNDNISNYASNVWHVDHFLRKFE